jgi:hypothetical protein
MNLYDQVCSLELAQQLKELGVIQSSLFYWVAQRDKLFANSDRIFGIMYIDHFAEIDDINNYEVYSAFTVAELGNILPRAVSIISEEENKTEFCNFRLVTGKNVIIKESIPIIVWTVNYICDSTNEFRNWLFDKLLTHAIYDDNEANARAKMLIWLIVNGHVKVGE